MMQRLWFALLLLVILASGSYYGWRTYREYRNIAELGIAEEELNHCPALMDDAAIKSVHIYQQLEHAVKEGNLFIVQRNSAALSTYLSKINPEASAAAKKLALVGNPTLARDVFQKFDQLLEPKTKKAQPNILILP